MIITVALMVCNKNLGAYNGYVNTWSDEHIQLYGISIKAHKITDIKGES